MYKKITFSLAMLYATSLMVFGQTRTVLMDFGDPTQTTSGNWTNITKYTNDSVALKDDTGALNGDSLIITDAFYNGSNLNGTTTPADPAASLFLASATRDNFFGNTLYWNPADANPMGAFILKGLDASKYYSFTVFASRTGVSDNRETRYSVIGANGTLFADLNAANNTSNVAQINNMQPNSSGVLTFQTEAGPNNNNSIKFYFLGAIKMTRTDSPTTNTINPTADSKLQVIYKNGNLQIGDFTGIVRVYDIAGRSIKEGNAIFGYLSMPLQKGIYLLKAATTTSKFIVD